MHFLGCGLNEAVQTVTTALNVGGGLPEKRQTAVKSQSNKLMYGKVAAE